MLRMSEVYYFSPTGGTKKVAESFAKGLAEKINMVDLGQKKEKIENPETDVVVVAAPVFGGRIPQLVADKLSQLKGCGQKAVTLVVYGNRAYEDALLELNHVMKDAGFRVIASGAFNAQHSVVPEVGKGRPDEQDIAEIQEFAKKVLDKIENNMINEVNVPGNTPYKDAMKVPAPPISLPACNQCGKCVEVCPVDAISIENDAIITNPETCILCMGCVVACSQNTRVLPPPLQEKMNQMLEPFRLVRSGNEMFL